MSLLLYSQIPGTQVKRDVDLSNATIQCDPKLLFPLGASQGGVPLNKENLAGKIAVEHDICNLDVNNLTVNGVLVANGRVEMCDIFCPDTFSVVAVNQITMQALGNPTGNRGNIALIAGDDATIAQTPGTADECIMLSAASAGTQTQSSDSQIMLTAGEGDCTQERNNSILISAAGTGGTQLQQSENSILLTTNDGGVNQTVAGEILLAAQSAILMEGVTDGIGLGFQETIAADSLKMSTLTGAGFTNTQSAGSGAAGNITPGNVGTAVGANGGAVQAVLRLTVAGIDFATGNFGSGANAGLGQGDVTEVFEYYNDKIIGIPASNVLISYYSESSTVSAGVHLDVQLVAVNAGLLQLRFINLGSVAQTAAATNVGFLNVLVINPLP